MKDVKHYKKQPEKATLRNSQIPPLRLRQAEPKPPVRVPMAVSLFGGYHFQVGLKGAFFPASNFWGCFEGWGSICFSALIWPRVKGSRLRKPMYFGPEGPLSQRRGPMPQSLKESTTHPLHFIQGPWPGRKHQYIPYQFSFHPWFADVTFGATDSTCAKAG